MAKKKTNKAGVIGLAIVTTISLAGLGGAFTANPPTGGEVADSTNYNQAINDANLPPCLLAGTNGVHPEVAFHIHPKLSISVDGENLEIPADIGITPDCMREIHTHDTSGSVHVESVSEKSYIFADVLNILGFGIEQPGFITRLTVNGEFDDNNINFALEDEQDIQLEFITIPGFGSTGSSTATSSE